MARVTVEDCIDKVDSPYELVLVAKERATQLNSGIEPTVEKDNDKNTVISLREIAADKIKVPDLEESAIYKLRKHVEQVDDTSEDVKRLVIILKIYTKEKYQKVELQYYHQKELEKFLKKFKFQMKI